MRTVESLVIQFTEIKKKNKLLKGFGEPVALYRLFLG
jgi:hypothetical protein